MVAGPQEGTLPNRWMLAFLAPQVTQNLIDCKPPYLRIQQCLFVTYRILTTRERRCQRGASTSHGPNIEQVDIHTLHSRCCSIQTYFILTE